MSLEIVTSAKIGLGARRMVRLGNIVCLASAFWLCVVATPRTGAAAPDENILLLGVTRAGKPDQRLAKDLSDHLVRSGESVNQRATLSATDRACTDQECLDRLANRENAQVVLTTQLQENGADAYYVVMTLFDAVRHSPLAERNLCDQCTGDTLTLKLSDTADKLLKRYRDRKNGVAVDPAGAPPDRPPAGTGVIGQPDSQIIQAPPSTTPSKGWTLSPKRKIIVGVLGGLAVATLATSIALTAINGNSTDGMCSYMGQSPEAGRCTLNTKAVYSLGYAATAALLLGVGLTIGLP